MSMSDAWKLLTWTHVCNLVPEINMAHDAASEQAEHGINWYEFINTDPEMPRLKKMAQKWWNKLPEEEKLRLLRCRSIELAELQAQLEAVCPERRPGKNA